MKEHRTKTDVVRRYNQAKHKHRGKNTTWKGEEEEEREKHRVTRASLERKRTPGNVKMENEGGGALTAQRRPGKKVQGENCGRVGGG